MWDNINQHRSVLVKQFLSTTSRLRLHRFPGYTPELNPDEFVWTYLKRAVSNTVPTDLPHLKRLIHPPLQRLRQNQRLLWACVKASDLSWPDSPITYAYISSVNFALPGSPDSGSGQPAGSGAAR